MCGVCPAAPVTPTDGSKTWGRSAVCKKEDLSSSKKKGRTWGPSSTHQKERVGGEEKYVHSVDPDVITNKRGGAVERWLSSVTLLCRASHLSQLFVFNTERRYLPPS